jgi:hypothetical protein
LSWVFHYVLLINCCSTKDDAVGAWLVLCGPRGVICIMRGVIDKAGLNRLLVPHQSPFSPLNQSSLFPQPPCLLLTLPTPTPFLSTLSIMARGNVPLPRSPLIVNVSSRREGLGPPHILPLWTSTEGWHGPLWRLIRSMICTWQTLLSPTKGGGELGEMFDISNSFSQGFLTSLEGRFLYFSEFEGSP